MDTSQQVKHLYQKRFKQYGADPRSLLWATRGAAHQRFRQFWSEIDFSHKSVLDIGCGFGELGKFLVKRYEGVKYLGIDIVPEFIKEGKKLYPYLDLNVADYIETPNLGQYDIVIASGILNSNLENNTQYRKDAIKKMFRYAKKVLAFNMLGSHPQPKNNPKSNIWYADSLEVLKYCMTLTRRVLFRANYHPRDFTVFMYRIKDES